jgi:hypothetical protein
VAAKDARDVNLRGEGFLFKQCTFAGEIQIKTLMAGMELKNLKQKKAIEKKRRNAGGWGWCTF